jgi:hypothetical protein
VGWPQVVVAGAVRDRHGGERQPGRWQDSLAPGRRTPAGEDVQDHVGTHRAAGERFLAGQGDGVEALAQDRCRKGDELPVRLVTAPESAADSCQRRRQRPVPERCPVAQRPGLRTRTAR